MGNDKDMFHVVRIGQFKALKCITRNQFNFLQLSFPMKLQPCLIYVTEKLIFFAQCLLR